MASFLERVKLLEDDLSDSIKQNHRLAKRLAVLENALGIADDNEEEDGVEEEFNEFNLAVGDVVMYQRKGHKREKEYTIEKIHGDQATITPNEDDDDSIIVPLDLLEPITDEKEASYYVIKTSPSKPLKGKHTPWYLRKSKTKTRGFQAYWSQNSDDAKTFPSALKADDWLENLEDDQIEIPPNTFISTAPYES
jgi:hypothetical protein